MKLSRFMERKERTSLIILSSVLFIFCVIYILISSPIKLVGDAISYDQSAIDLLAGNGYIWDGWHSQVPPFYSLFLAFIYGVCTHSPLLIYIIQAMFNVITGIFIFLIAKQEFKNPKAGLFAIAMMIVSPTLYRAVGFLSTYNLFMMLMACTIFVFFRALRTEKIGLFILTGFLLGIATLTRTTAFLLWIPMFIYGFFFWYKKKLNKLLLFIPLVLVMFLVLTPWAIYNYKVQKEVIFTSLNIGYSLWLTSAPKEDKSYSDLPGAAQFKIYITEFRKFPEIQANKIFLDRAKENIRKHPKDYFFTAITNIGRLYIKFPYSKPPSLFIMLFMLLNLIIIALAIKGFFIDWRKNLFIGFYICYFTAVHSLFHIAWFWYNIQTLPFLFLLASSGVMSLLKSPAFHNVSESS
ncbi:MAG: glycosyltransferase family 39 protein [bacterium]|nr:glycosyltransferase family 39 protein [bacterium]